MFYPVLAREVKPTPEAGIMIWEIASRDFPQMMVSHVNKAAALELMGHMILHSMSNIATAYERIPEPSGKHADEEMISVGLAAWLRVMLFNTLFDSGMNYELLIHKAGMSRQQVDNLLDFYCRVPAEDLELALQQVGFVYDVKLRSIDSITAV